MATEYLEKCTQDLNPGDFILNVGYVERVGRRIYHGGRNYYWLEFSRPQFNQSAEPIRRWYCMKNPPRPVMKKGESVRGVTIE